MKKSTILKKSTLENKKRKLKKHLNKTLRGKKVNQFDGKAMKRLSELEAI